MLLRFGFLRLGFRRTLSLVLLPPRSGPLADGAFNGTFAPTRTLLALVQFVGYLGNLGLGRLGLGRHRLGTSRGRLRLRFGTSPIVKRTGLLLRVGGGRNGHGRRWIVVIHVRRDGRVGRLLGVGRRDGSGSIVDRQNVDVREGRSDGREVGCDGGPGRGTITGDTGHGLLGKAPIHPRRRRRRRRRHLSDGGMFVFIRRMGESGGGHVEGVLIDVAERVIVVIPHEHVLGRGISHLALTLLLLGRKEDAGLVGRPGERSGTRGRDLKGVQSILVFLIIVLVTIFLGVPVELAKDLPTSTGRARVSHGGFIPPCQDKEGLSEATYKTKTIPSSLFNALASSGLTIT